MKHKIRDLLSRAILLTYAFPMFVFAAQAPQGIGKVANSIMEPVSIVTDFVHSACLLLGGAFVFASIIKYFEHRRSPTMVTLSTVVFLFLAGVVLLCLPLIAYLQGKN